MYFVLGGLIICGGMEDGVGVDTSLGFVAIFIVALDGDTLVSVAVFFIVILFFFGNEGGTARFKNLIYL